MNAAAVPITALYAGLLALLMLVLARNVIRGRYRAKVGLFDGGVYIKIKSISPEGKSAGAAGCEGCNITAMQSE